jgi:phosphate/sulfate permease
MNVDVYLLGVGVLLLFAVMDLIVGVSNDAVNFLNTPIGSKVVSRRIIMAIAAAGILTGVLLSSGMMEIARKGIFHPELFTMPELMALFLAVMLADIVILDIFNTYGLPTSTTVSVVFELLGAAVAISLIKILQAGGSPAELGGYINTAKAMTIIFGILLSVAIAFVAGTVVQFLTRFVFTFRYEKTLRRYGGIWGGLAVASILLLILFKGIKGATFMTPEMAAWLQAHFLRVIAVSFVVSACILQFAASILRFNILKPIVLFGTFALAMAFAANDLVNFIGVPLAGYQAHHFAMLSDSPETVPMTALRDKLHSEGYFLFIAGVIMVVTLWRSRKARTVGETELSLSSQEEGVERFESMGLARVIVRMTTNLLAAGRRALPAPVVERISHRFRRMESTLPSAGGDTPRFDLLRASVNLVVASALVSAATTFKLPLSTTYVTFMVAMGTSFADRAWDREIAVYRVTGVLTVIGGWFMTALMAFMLAFLLAGIIYFAQAPGVAVLLGLVGLTLWRLHHMHRERQKEVDDYEIFNLKKITDAPAAIAVTFEHTARLLQEVQLGLDRTLDALFRRDLVELRNQRRLVKRAQTWSNIITANIFKAMRLLQRSEMQLVPKYSLSVRCLQSLVDAYRDVVLRSYLHVNDHHKELLPVQVSELQQVKELILTILLEVETVLLRKEAVYGSAVRQKNEQLEQLIDEFSAKQIERIRMGASKTRLSILYYSIMGDVQRVARQNLRLIEIFKQSLLVQNFSPAREPETVLVSE